MTTELVQNTTDGNDVMVSTSREVMISDTSNKSLKDFCEDEIRNSKDKLEKIFSSKKKNKYIWWESGLEKSCNDLESCGYKPLEIQKIIRKNKEALPLLVILIDRADKSLLKDKDFIDNVNNFFDLADGKYKSLLKSSHFNRILDEYYNPRAGKITNKDLELYLSLLCKNGYSDGLTTVRVLFNDSFSKYTKKIEDCENQIKNEENNRKSFFDAMFTEADFANLKDSARQAFCKEDVNFKDALKSLIGKDKFDHYNKFCKQWKNQIKNIDSCNKKISELKKCKKIARDEFKIREELYFSYFRDIINNQIFSDENFSIDNIQYTFIQMCEDLWSILGKYDDEEEIYTLIRNSLDNVIPCLLDYSKIVMKNNAYSYSQYCRLNRLYQSFYRFTSDEEVKIKIVTDYVNSEFAPIPFEIIEDGLNIEKFSNLKDRKLIVKCIEKIYRRLHKLEENIINKNEDFLTNRLSDINLKAIYDMQLPEDVRECAFEWFFDDESCDEASKKKFCWKVIEELDKKENLSPCDSRNYKCSYDFLVLNEEDSEIENYLTSIMKSDGSNGLIVDFVSNYSTYKPSFSGEKEKYKNKLKVRNIKKDFDVSYTSIWDERKTKFCKK